MEFKKNQNIKSRNLIKINDIENNIYMHINNEQDKSYYHELCTYITRLIMDVYTHNEEDNNELLKNIDLIYCNLKKDLRLIDDYLEFNNLLSKKKRKYKKIFDQSIIILNLLEDKYGKEVVNQYLINFDINFSNIKASEINNLNKLNRIAKGLYENYKIIELTKTFNMMKNIDNDLIIKLNEPNRLRDKFLSAEDNIEQMEGDLLNKKGSLYYKVFNAIKNNKVSKEDVEQWNIIKRNINQFNKNKLLKMNIIELNNKLNDIICDLSDLNVAIVEDIHDVSTYKPIVSQ